MATAIVTRNYQITLPKDVRDIERIKIGDKLIIEAKDESIELRKFTRERLLTFFGVWKTKEDSVKFVRKLRDEGEQRLRRLDL